MNCSLVVLLLLGVVLYLYAEAIWEEDDMHASVFACAAITILFCVFALAR